jgi:hypothetical protein
MDNLENQPVLAAPQPEVADLRAQFESLRHLVISVLVLLIVVSGTFNIFLLRQAKSARADVLIIQPQITQLVAEYKKSSEPAINTFVKQLSEFGRTHPDFAPVLAKYGIKPGMTTGTAPTNAAPPPAAAPKK